MKTKSLVAALLLSSCLTILASYPSTITQENVNQIRPGQTTEADLVNLFGIPTTRFVDLTHYTAIDWFRSVPAPAQSYIPFIGPCLGGLKVEAQQLTVVLSPGGTVVRYEVHSSRPATRSSGRPAFFHDRADLRSPNPPAYRRSKSAVTIPNRPERRTCHYSCRIAAARPHHSTLPPAACA